MAKVKISHKVQIQRKPVNRYEIVRYQDDNAKLSLNDNRYYIGSSYKEKAVLRGLTNEEEEMFLKDIIGVSPKHDTWKKETEAYWANIREYVPAGIGLVLEVGFEYPSQEEADEAAKHFDNANRGKDDLRDYTFEPYYTHGGKPINVANYVLYRYCIVWNRIANSLDVANRSANIMFIMVNEADEKKQKAALSNLRKSAYGKFLLIVSDGEAVDNLVRIITDFKNKNLSAVMVGNPAAMTIEDKEVFVEEFVKSNPQEFLEFANDKNLQMKAFIFECISQKFLTRIPNTDAIKYQETVLGHDVEEAMINLQNTNNQLIFDLLKSKIYKVSNNVKVKDLNEIRPVVKKDEPVLIKK